MHQTSTNSTLVSVSVTESRTLQPWVIALRGELDISSRDLVGEYFALAGTQPGDRIVVDASEVTFLDCGGLHVLLAAAAAAGREVWLRAPSRSVRWIVELVGLAEEWRATASNGDLRIA